METSEYSEADFTVRVGENQRRVFQIAYSVLGNRRARLSWVYDCVDREEAAMRTPMHWRTERGRHFQAHPLHATFSLVASMLLAGLVVLALVLSAR